MSASRTVRTRLLSGLFWTSDAHMCDGYDYLRGIVVYQIPGTLSQLLTLAVDSKAYCIN